MALSSKHPDYIRFLNDWLLMQRSYLGQDSIKEAGTEYLPATQAMVAMGMTLNTPGRVFYDAYRKRALYPSFVREAVGTLLGALWTNPPNIELPTALEYLRTKATLANEGLDQLLMRIHEAILSEGRYGVLLDLAVDKTLNVAQPYFATYQATQMFNWDAGLRDDKDAMQRLNLVVLDETEAERQEDMTWVDVKKYRVLVLGDPVVNEKTSGLFGVAVVRNAEEFDPTAVVVPNCRGIKLDEIPFVFFNPKDLMTSPDVSPLKSVAELALAVYRGDADYRQTLFMQSQDTLVITGRTDTAQAVRIGAGATIDVPLNGDAKFIGVASTGLSEQREALQNDKNAAKEMTGSLIDAVSRQKESGAALHTRVQAKTASLNQIARTSASGLERLLKLAARWVGADEGAVKVEPNLDFANLELDSRTVVELMTAKGMGAPISNLTIHNLMAKRGVTELTFDEEVAEIEGELPLVAPQVVDAAGNPVPVDALGNPVLPNDSNNQPGSGSNSANDGPGGTG